MSILGYSASYFLPQYWAGTPFYGEKLIPLLDYILSTDYTKTDQLATAFYNIESKYKNTSDLPIEQIEAIIDESGYTYIRNLLGQDEESLRLLVYLLVMIHQLKGSKKGVETVLSLLKGAEGDSTVRLIGDVNRTEANVISGFSPTSYAVWSGVNLNTNTLELSFKIATGNEFLTEQCVASSPHYGFYLGIDSMGKLVLKLGKRDSTINGRSWQEVDGTSVFVSDRALDMNTTYYIILEYTGYEYNLRVSTDGTRYYFYKTVNSSTPIASLNNSIYLGVDISEGNLISPFKGSIYLSPLTVASSGISIKSWYEIFPVDKENTFTIDSELDGDVISAQFFDNFARFIENYVYPTLSVFRAKLKLKGGIAVIPYVRSNVTYVAFNALSDRQVYCVKETETSRKFKPFMTISGEDPEVSEEFQVKRK